MSKMTQNDPHRFCTEIMYPWFFVIFGQKSAFVYQPHMEHSGIRGEALCVAFGDACCVSICGDLINPVAPTTWGATGDVATA